MNHTVYTIMWIIGQIQYSYAEQLRKECITKTTPLRQGLEANKHSVREGGSQGKYSTQLHLMLY